MSSGIRMMPREQYLLIRTKPYLHDDQTTPEDVLSSLLSEHNHVSAAAEMETSDDISQQQDQLMMNDGVPGTSCDDATIVKLEPE